MLPIEVLLVIASSSALAFGQAHELHAHQEVLIDDNARTRNTATARNTYQCFHGNISNYPAPKSWLSFTDLWNINREQILSSNGGDTYIQHYIHTAILQISRESNLDPRLILALIMGESKGKASTPCTTSIPRRGILHARKGSTFNECNPEDSIAQMIREGIMSEPRRGLGYAQILKGKPRMANVEPGCPFAAARAYHDGGVKKDLNRSNAGGEDGFVNDFANRLLGWDGRGEGFDQC